MYGPPGMTSFPGSPRTQRGALAAVGPLSATMRVVTFQYNPHTLSRSFEITGTPGGPEVGQLSRPPAESVRVELELDAADELEKGQRSSVGARLAALEMLATPPSAFALANVALTAAGTIEIMPPGAPLTLFVWGASRVLPVTIRELAITEEAHDPQLQVTRARVTLGMRVLSWADVSPMHPAFGLTVAAQVIKEVQSLSVTVASLDAVAGVKTS